MSTTYIKLHQTDTPPLLDQQQKCSNWHLPADGTAAEMQSFTVASVFRCARSISVHSCLCRDPWKEQNVAVQHLPDLWVLQLLVNWPNFNLALITCPMELQADHRVLKSDVPVSMPCWNLALWCESDLFVHRQVEPSNCKTFVLSSCQKNSYQTKSNYILTLKKNWSFLIKTIKKLKQFRKEKDIFFIISIFALTASGINIYWTGEICESAIRLQLRQERFKNLSWAIIFHNLNCIIIIFIV